MKKILNSILILSVASSLIFVGGCKKTSINGKVHSKTTTGGANAGTLTYSYDGQGRLQTLQNVTSGATATLTYTQGNVTIVNTGTGVTTNYTLNAQGYASSDGVNQFTYNNGYESQEIEPGGASVTFNVSNGDVTSVTTINAGTSIVTYTYSSTVDYRDYGLNFLGKNSLHLASSGNDNGTPVSYTYQYDSKGRVGTEIVTENGTIVTTTYQYLD